MVRFARRDDLSRYKDDWAGIPSIDGVRVFVEEAGL